MSESIDFNKIKDLVCQRDEFLAEHPELQPLQDKVNEVLQKAGKDHQRRNTAIQEMLLSTWFKITTI
jgi:hypothetical protein